jgi:mono/diheme cytochrome c family protein
MKLSTNPPDRNWLKTQLLSPQQHFSHTTMPSFNYLKSKDITSLLDFLQSLSLKNQITTPPPEMGVSGEVLFNTIGCAGCHTVSGHSAGTNGPDLLQAMSVRKPSREWLKVQINSPQQHFSNSSMPSFSYLHKDQMEVLIDYLKTLESESYPPPAVVRMLNRQPVGPFQDGPALHIVGGWEHGEVLYKQYCMLCHNPSHKNVPSLNPIRQDLYREDADSFVEEIDPVIQDGSHAMPAFAGKILTQAQIADIEAYILHVNGVDRGQIINPGIKPESFFRIVGITFLVLLVLAGFFFLKLRKSS